jgi:hypothetical protein
MDLVLGIEAFIGAIVGGLFALGGVWLSAWLQRRDDARTLRLTILAELETYRDAFTRRRREDRILGMLDLWESSGTAPHARLVADSLKMEPSVAFPVFYSRAGELGSLGVSDAAAVISHYSDAMGLLRSSHLILSTIRLDVDTAPAARQLRQDYLRVVQERNDLIAKLRRRPREALVVTPAAAP